jgi:hypothetical protein
MSAEVRLLPIGRSSQGCAASNGKEEKDMTRLNTLGRSLLLSLEVVVFLAVSGTAGEKKPAPTTSEPPKSISKEAAPAPQLTLEPKALDLLKAASRRLAAARTMSFSAVATHETPSRLGPPLLNMVKGEVVLQRPDKLRVLTPGDGRAFEFYYNGKTMMAYAPVENLVAFADAPPTIDAMLAEAYRLAAVSFPFADLISADPYKGIEPGLKVAFYIGQSHVVGGITTEMVAVGNDSAFAQLWIGADDHLPRMIRIMYLDDRLALRFQVEYSNWELDRTVTADAFASAKARSAPRIPFSRPDLLLPLDDPRSKAKQEKPAKTK